jgi:hypothetical protein
MASPRLRMPAGIIEAPVVATIEDDMRDIGILKRLRDG